MSGLRKLNSLGIFLFERIYTIYCNKCTYSSVVKVFYLISCCCHLMWNSHFVSGPYMYHTMTCYFYSVSKSVTCDCFLQGCVGDTPAGNCVCCYGFCLPWTHSSILSEVRFGAHPRSRSLLSIFAFFWLDLLGYLIKKCWHWRCVCDENLIC